jgi:hypothetical protein
LPAPVYITLVCLLPEFLVLKWNVPFYFGGTSLLIIVVVTMDFMAQVQAYVHVASVREPAEEGQLQRRADALTRAAERSMAKEDVHPDAGRDPREPAECDLPGQARERTRGTRAYLREDADALHPDPARRQGDGGADAVRLDSARIVFRAK